MALRKPIVLLSCILILSFSQLELYSQKLHLELKSITTNKVRKIYKNDLVIVHTQYKVYRGLIKIKDYKNISINGYKIKVDDITKIEKAKLKLPFKSKNK